MSLEALLVLLFTAFAVPVTCLLVCIGQLVRGMIRGRGTQRILRERRRSYDTAFR
jgi:hypothetical protein